MGSSLERGATRVAGFSDPEMDFQLMRQLGSVRYGGASVGETLALANKIADAEPKSWVDSFYNLAQKQEIDAKSRHDKGHLISARDQYLVACNSFRAAEYYCLIKDPLHRQLGLSSRQCFLNAMQCSDLVCDTWWFDENNKKLPAYYIHGKNSKNNKVLAIISGYDGTLEESWLVYGRPAFERGYDVVLFAGLGQMDSWRFNDNCYFTPRYEIIGSKVIDKILLKTQINSNKITLMGISFGGYFATRIAAFEPRLGALIVNSPIIDLHAYMTSFVGIDPANIADADNFDLNDLLHITPEQIDPQKNLMASNLIYRFGQNNFRDTYLYLKQFKLTDEELSRIQCPSLSLLGEGEGQNPKNQLDKFVSSVSGKASAYIFTAEQGADGHCQSANPAFSAAVSMDWLDDLIS